MTITDPVHLSPLRFKMTSDGVAAAPGSGSNLISFLRSRVKNDQPSSAAQVYVNGDVKFQHTPIFLNDLEMGAAGFQEGVLHSPLANLDFRALTVGWNGFGSANIFSNDFSGGTIVPPFFDYSNTGDYALTSGGGVMNCSGTNGTAIAADGSLSNVGHNLYAQFDIRFHADMLAAGGQSQRFFSTDAIFAGMAQFGISYNFDTSKLVFEYVATYEFDGNPEMKAKTVTYPISADTWYTIGVVTYPWS